MINKVILVGNLGRDPEIRHFEGDSSVAAFSVATDDSYFDKTTNQRVNRAQWVNVVLWNQLASVAERFLKKGSLVYIEGKLTTRKWQDKEGVDRYTTEVVGRVMKMLSKSESSGTYKVPSASDAPATTSTPETKAVENKEPATTAEVNKEPAAAQTKDTPAPEKTADAPDDDLPF